MKNKNNRTKVKKVAFVLLYLCFITLSAYTFYLYSLISDYVPWGDSLRDGLYFLAYFFIVFPLTLILSVVKLLLWKKNDYVRFSFFLYSLTVLGTALLSNTDAYSQCYLLIGMVVSLLVCCLTIVEYITIVHKRIFSG